MLDQTEFVVLFNRNSRFHNLGAWLGLEQFTYLGRLRGALVSPAPLSHISHFAVPLLVRLGLDS